MEKEAANSICMQNTSCSQVLQQSAEQINN